LSQPSFVDATAAIAGRAADFRNGSRRRSTKNGHDHQRQGDAPDGLVASFEGVKPQHRANT
jgi:hypothetical protein